MAIAKRGPMPPHAKPIYRARFATAIEAGHSWSCARAFAWSSHVDLVAKCLCPLRERYAYIVSRVPID